MGSKASRGGAVPSQEAEIPRSPKPVVAPRPAGVSHARPAFSSLAEEELDRLFAAYPLPARPKIDWRPYRVTAGMAYFRKNVIGLSLTVLKTEEAVRETLGHEYAHLLAVARHGPKAANHGPHWRKAMADLGLEPKVRHTYDVERNARRQVVTYRCVQCGASIQRSRRLPRRRTYVHAACGGGLRLESVTQATPI